MFHKFVLPVISAALRTYKCVSGVAVLLGHIALTFVQLPPLNAAGPSAKSTRLAASLVFTTENRAKSAVPQPLLQLVLS